MDITGTGIGLTCASTTPPGGGSFTGTVESSCGGSLRTGFGFGFGFGLGFVSTGTQGGISVLELLGGVLSLPVSGGLGSGGVGGKGGFSVAAGGGVVGEA
jgi:hypothetical protein